MTATISHTRLRVLFAFFTAASLLLSGRLAYWQTIGRADLLSRATDQVRSDLAVAAQRGVIRDRSNAKNIWQNAAIRSGITAPARWIRR